MFNWKDVCKSNPENSSAVKVGKHIPYDFLMSTTESFNSIEISMMYTEVKIVWKFCEYWQLHYKVWDSFWQLKAL